MQQAADTNPTENRVFDVSLLLEKIVEDYTNLKNNVKNKVYDLLTVQQGVITQEKYADWVWKLLEEYGFRSVGLCTI